MTTGHHPTAPQKNRQSTNLHAFHTHNNLFTERQRDCQRSTSKPSPRGEPKKKKLGPRSKKKKITDTSNRWRPSEKKALTAKKSVSYGSCGGDFLNCSRVTYARRFRASDGSFKARLRQAREHDTRGEICGYVRCCLYGLRYVAYRDYVFTSSVPYAPIHLH